MDHHYLKNLIVIAYSDGIIMDKELDLLKSASVEAGVSPKELNDLIKNAGNLKPELPDNDQEREELLIEMIKMATADGIFTEEEYSLCRLLADSINSNGVKQALRISMSKSSYKNLIALAWADGKMHESEVQILKDAAKQIGLSKDEAEELINGSSKFLPFIPENDEEREVQLIQMISIAISDEYFSKEEYELCKIVAKRLGFSEDELKMIIKLSYKGEISFD